MMKRVVTGLMLVVAIIHLLPLSGVLGAERLAVLYGVDLDESNLEILMRHRAVLFGLLGGYFAYAAFHRSHQPAAFVIAAISIASFLMIAWSVGDFNAAIRRVVIADLIAMVALVGAIAAYSRSLRTSRQA